MPGGVWRGLVLSIGAGAAAVCGVGASVIVNAGTPASAEVTPVIRPAGAVLPAVASQPLVFASMHVHRGAPMVWMCEPDGPPPTAAPRRAAL